MTLKAEMLGGLAMGYLIFDLVVIGVIVYWVKQRNAKKKANFSEKTASFNRESAIQIANSQINLESKQLLIDSDVINFSEIIGYTPHIDGGTKKKHHSLIRAATGGALFGGAGAIVGAVTGGKKVDYITRMDAVIVTKDGNSHTVKFLPLPQNSNTVLVKKAETDMDRFDALIGQALK